MTDRFAKCLPWVLSHEGGFVHHPRDPGGATNRGVTQRTYDGWRQREGQATRSVREITEAEVAAVYRRGYWDAVRADGMPAGVSYAVFDFAVNSGPTRAAIYLQDILGVAPDGRVGPITLGALARSPSRETVVRRLCRRRMTFLRSLSHWPAFGKGWAARVDDVLERALALVQADKET